MNSLQSYTLEQLKRLYLNADLKAWKEAFEYIGFDCNDSEDYAKYIIKYGILNFISNYMCSPSDLEHFDFAVIYLMKEFNII